MSICLTTLLYGCKTSEPAAVAGQPVVVGTDTVATVTAVTVGKKSTVTVQVGGTGNVASTAKTDNAGRNAASGANGGHSEAKSTSTPIWVYVALFLAGGAVVVWWQRRKASKVAAVLLVLCSLSAQVEARPRPPRYKTLLNRHDKAERKAARTYAKVVRYYKAQNRQKEREKRRLQRQYKPDPTVTSYQ